jgi:hypothetical protein
VSGPGRTRCRRESGDVWVILPYMTVAHLPEQQHPASGRAGGVRA